MKWYAQICDYGGGGVIEYVAEELEKLGWPADNYYVANFMLHSKAQKITMDLPSVIISMSVN